MENLEIQEYSRLCSEVQLIFKFILNISTVGFSFFVGILGYGISLKNSGLIACAGIPAILAIFIICSLIQSSHWITSYLIVFYEGKEKGIYWEQRLYALIYNIKRKLNLRSTLMSIILILSFFASTIISLGFSIQNSENNIPAWSYYSMLSAEFIGFIIALLMIFRVEKVYKATLTIWKELKEKEINI